MKQCACNALNQLVVGLTGFQKSRLKLRKKPVEVHFHKTEYFLGSLFSYFNSLKKPNIFLGKGRLKLKFEKGRLKLEKGRLQLGKGRLKLSELFIFFIIPKITQSTRTLCSLK